MLTGRWGALSTGRARDNACRPRRFRCVRRIPGYGCLRDGQYELGIGPPEQGGYLAALIQREEILSLTGLRFLAALSVASAHGSSVVGLGPTAAGYWVSTTAAIGMQLFFVLSGFVIHYNYRDAATVERGGKGRFLWARFARLIPLYAFMLFVDLISRTNYSLRNGSPDTVHLVLEALPFYLTLTQSWFYILLGNTSIIYAILPTMELSWSVSTEWFFYLAYIPLVFVVVSIKRPLVTVIA